MRSTTSSSAAARDARPATLAGRWWALAIVVVLAVAVGLLMPLSGGRRTAWIVCLLDIGHIPLFALLVVVLWRAFRHRILPAVVISVGLAGLFEVAQASVGRTVDFTDFLRGALGAVLAAICLNLTAAPRSARRLAIGSILFAAGTIWPVGEAAPVVLDAYRQYQIFPVLCDFRYAGGVDRWYTQDAVLTRVKPAGSDGRWAGLFHCTPSEWGTGGGVLFPAVRDWSGYRQVCFEFEFAGDPIHFLISIRDGRKVEPPAQRFDLRLKRTTGQQTVRIDLAALDRGDELAPLDLTRIESVHFMATGLQHHRWVILPRVYLR